MPNSDGSPHFISLEHKEKGDRLAREIMLAAGEYDQQRPRTVQGMAGGLGFSDLGGCREYIRASVQGDERIYPANPLKLAAFVGTWGGEGLENAVAWKFGDQVETQLQLTLDLGDGIVISGSSDIIWLGENAVIDLKSKAELATVRRDGPSMKEWIQISGYLVACIQAGLLDQTATAHLVYWDRSGQDPEAHAATIDFTIALSYLALARARLEDVATAVENGTTQDFLRDEPESWCYAVGCPFYFKCWPVGVYTPTEDITDPALIKAVDDYAAARDEEKDIGKIKASRRELLKLANGAGDIHYVTGRTDKWIVKWTLVENPSGRVSERLEVRPRPVVPPSASEAEASESEPGSASSSTSQAATA